MKGLKMSKKIENGNEILMKMRTKESKDAIVKSYRADKDFKYLKEHMKILAKK